MKPASTKRRHGSMLPEAGSCHTRDRQGLHRCPVSQAPLHTPLSTMGNGNVGWPSAMHEALISNGCMCIKLLLHSLLIV